MMMSEHRLKEQYNAWMNEGLACRRAADMDGAIKNFSQALTYQPLAGIAYRYRGPFYLAVRRFIEGAADLSLAAQLLPDNWDVWYHLGLAYYLLGDDARALEAYQVCFDMTTANDENLVAIADWMYLTKRNLQDEAAADCLDGIDASTEVGENIAYKNRILVYRGIWSVDDGMAWFNDSSMSDIDRLTFAYGFSHYLNDHGHTEQAKDVLSRLRHLAAEGSLRYAFAALADEARNGR